MDSNLNQLAPIDFNEGLILGQQPHESGFRASTFDAFSKWLNVRLDLQGAELIDPTAPGTVESPAIIPPGPEDRKGKFEPEPGFYHGFEEVTSDKRWYFYWDMSSWSLKDMGELPKIPVNGIVEEGNPNATSGDEVYRNVFDAVKYVSVNKFDKNRGLINGVRINGVTGVNVEESGAAITKRIKVKPSTVYFLKGRTNTSIGFRFIDSSGNALTPINPSNNTPNPTFVFNNGTALKSPSTAEYAQFDVKNGGIGSLDGVMFYEGDADVPYKEYKLEFDTSLLPHQVEYLDQETFVVPGGINLLNPKIRKIEGYRIAAATGADFKEYGSAVTAPIPIKGDTVYTIKGRTNSNNGARLIDANGNYLQFLTGTTEAGFVLPNNTPRRTSASAKYLQFVYKNNGVGTLDNVMLYEGSTDKPFESFIPIINPDKIKGLTGVTQQGGYNGTAKDLKDLIDTNAASILQNAADIVTAQGSADEAKLLAQIIAQSLPSKIGIDDKGSPGGVATLNENGKIPVSQIDMQGFELKGNWNASNNTPFLANGTGQVNNYYLVSQAGTVDFGDGPITFDKGDKVVYSTEGKWAIDKQKEIPKPISDLSLLATSNFVRVSDTLYNVYSETSKEMISFSKVSAFPNGLPIDDVTIDDIIYRKIGNEYFALSSFLANGEVHTKQYGILSDGVTNDQPRFQRLVNLLHYIGGGTIKLAKGRTRLLNEGVKWYSNVNLVGLGFFTSILQCDATKTNNLNLNGIYNVDMPSDGSVWSPLRNCYFGDFMIDCSGYHNVGISNVGRKGMFILGLEYCAINRVFVYKSIGTGIGCDFISRTAITNCIVMECGSYIGDGHASEIGQSGIGIGTNARSDESVVVDGNWCINNGNYQIFVESQGNDANAKSNFAKIVNNHCFGGRYGIGNKGSGSIQAIGNTCYNQSRYGIHHIQLASGSIYANNDIAYSGEAGIFVLSNYVVDDTITITNNRVHNNLKYGIYINQYTNNVDILGNAVYANGYTGLLLNYYCKNVSVRTNKFYNNGKANLENQNFGVYLRGGYHNIVKDNIFYDSQNVKTQLIGIKIYKGRTITSSENALGYEFLTLKASILQGNILTGYSSNAISPDTGVIENTDYILSNNVITA